MIEDIKLTSMTKSAGWAAKISPMDLANALKNLKKVDNINLLVGFDTSDDAAVYKINEDTAIIQTLDFFTPVVDDPYTFGQIAAANALSDVYAMGGVPTVAMNIVGFPDCLDMSVLGEILRGGQDKVIESGAVLVGGHSIRDAEPKYGLSVSGIVHPDYICRNNGAKINQNIILTKPIGTGIINSAVKANIATTDEIEESIKVMSTLNSYPNEIIKKYNITAMTDITGFGLLGHLKEMSENNNISIKLNLSSISMINSAIKYASIGVIPKGLYDNKSFVEPYIKCEDYIKSEPLYDILFDPQTSGGLAICVDEEYTHDLVKDLKNHGCLCYDIIGKIVEKQDKNIIIAWFNSIISYVIITKILYLELLWKFIKIYHLYMI